MMKKILLCFIFMLFTNLVNAGTVTLQWSGYDGNVDGFYVYEGTSPSNLPFTKVGEEYYGTYTHTILNVPSDSVQCFAVTAYLGEIQSAYSNIICVVWDPKNIVTVAE